MRNRILSASVALFVAFAFAQAMADVYYIDQFSDPFYLYVHGWNGPPQDQVNETGLEGVLGGNRSATLTSFGSRGVSAEILHNGMELFIDSETRGGANLNIKYQPYLPIAISGAGMFQMSVTTSDVADNALPVQVTLVTGTGTATNTQMISNIGVYEWHFNEFISSDSIAWNDIKSIDLDFMFSDGAGEEIPLTSIDIIFGSLSVVTDGTVAIVPAPASLLLVFLGLGTLVARKRR